MVSFIFSIVIVLVLAGPLCGQTPATTPTDKPAPQRIGIEKALELHEAAVRREPDRAELHASLGHIYVRAGRYQEGISACKKAIDLNPNLALAYINLGEAYHNLARYKEMLEVSEKAINLKPDSAAAYCNLGAALGGLGRYHEAVEALKKAVRLAPTSAIAQNNLGHNLSQLGRYQEAMEAFKEAIRLNPNYPMAQNNLAAIHIKFGNYEEASELLKAALRIQPNFTMASQNLAVANEKLRNRQTKVQLSQGDSQKLDKVQIEKPASRDTGLPAGEPPTSSQRLDWRNQMDVARRMAAAGHNYVLVAQGKGVFVFYNNPRPFSYTYMIPGDWVTGKEPNAYNSKDGRAFVGVAFILPRNLEGLEGATMIEQARTGIIRTYEKQLGQPLADVELVPFTSAHPKTWRLRVASIKQKDLPRGWTLRLAEKTFVDLSPDAVVVITIAGTPDNDGLAREIIKNLRTTKDPECFWQVLERMLKRASGEP